VSESKTAFQIERIAFFSDAIFAIAITLLVIEIHAPIFNSEVTATEAIREFLQLMPEFFAVLVSFYLISLNWRRHHQLYGILSSYDEKLITLNFLALVPIIFLPFSAAFFSKNWGHFWINPLALPFVIYSLNNLACAFFNYLLFRYALNPQNKLYAPDDSLSAEKLRLEALFQLLVFAVTTIAGCFNYVLALPFFALFAFEQFFVKLMLRGKNIEPEIRN
jgi:uncharacterized membrane protein